MGFRSTTGATVTPPPDIYLRLVTDFPLVPIESDEHLEAASRMLDELLQEEEDVWTTRYIDVLSSLVHEYESRVYPMRPVGEAAMLRHLLEAKGVTQAQFAGDVGIAPSTVSAMLSGTRRMTRDHLMRVAAHFGVSPQVFLQDGSGVPTNSPEDDG